MAKQTNTTVFKITPKIKRKGVHSKTKASASKSSKNYVKKYIGQGR
jgi:hypothetical protein